MQKQPLKYRLNVVGLSLIIFMLIRTYLPMFAEVIFSPDSMMMKLVNMIITSALACVIPVIVMENMCEFRPKLFSGNKFKPEYLSIVVSSLFLILAFSIINRGIFTLFGRLGLTFRASELMKVGSTGQLIIYFITMTVVPAVFEEIMMRGYILNLLIPNGNRFSIVLVSLLFALMHTQIQTLGVAFAAGMIIACVYKYTDNIYVAMAIHFLNNMYSFIMLYMKDNVNGISYLSFAVFVIAILLVAGVVSVIYNRKKDIHMFEIFTNSVSNSKLSSVRLSPVLILAIAALILLAVSNGYNQLVM